VHRHTPRGTVDRGNEPGVRHVVAKGRELI
jgi:hypothetical protein